MGVTLLYSGYVVIPARSVSAIRPRTLAGSDCSGSAILTSNQSLKATCQITRNSNEMCMSYPAISSAENIVYYPDFTDSNDPNSWRSWFVIQNPTDSNANIDITLRSRTETLLYSGNSTIPANSVAAIRPKTLVGSDCAGSAVVTSDQPIVGTCQITRNSNKMCMSYPAIGSDVDVDWLSSI